MQAWREHAQRSGEAKASSAGAATQGCVGDSEIGLRSLLGEKTMKRVGIRGGGADERLMWAGVYPGMAARRFIIVEKDDDLREIHRLKLEKRFQGCVVAEAASCADALTALAQAPADAVVVNQTALDCSGLEAVSRIRQAHATTPVISVGPERVAATALKNGATVFLDDRRWGELAATVAGVLR